MKLISAKYLYKKCALLNLFLIIIGVGACSVDSEEPGVDQNPEDEIGFQLTDIKDSYGSISSFSNSSKWGPYNVHDPSVIKVGDWFYSYSTDVAYGQPLIKVGIQVRKSKNLVEWEFVGWAYDGLPQQAVNYIKSNGGEPFENLWAPYILQVEGKFRLYYSLSSGIHKLSAIGLLTSDSPEGPWQQAGLAVTSDTDLPMTNAIDPSVIIDQEGKHWMYYGSAYDGIYVVELDPETGLAKTSGDKGKRIAQRGFTDGVINGNIEGPEVIYRKENGYYYLFLSYDWLESKYNIRVGRSRNPEGPFLDFHGNDMNVEQDNGPMIVAPYKFQGHAGWQGTAHNAAFKDDDQYFIAHQGRPSADRFYMIMHVRKLYWTEDGWPVASPERFADLLRESIQEEDLVGLWEQIVLGYQVVPGFAAEQVDPNHQVSYDINLQANGTIDGNSDNVWSYQAPWLTLNYGNGVFVDKVYVDQGYDWENHQKTLIYTGLNNEGTAIWGKKK
ncbi:arabinan endo-1,5-alpha-L-arabinosidase [Echinicola jeungdonensis]|uniref:Arabinan endo-1,5-alpha-L-arabinosidase n=1 Tax=Echinicola jeungdonensis TaxID=709343 RepID=A0ABV5J1H5_9BACT|nr:arabinan endo-1,5-alpha-L-arabinosidase [Echinicola jeungdonensis]MDN3668515.1 arabinan endo-1,5-alpha-L-arabinosidase [Echinicola jeungdonensis]